MSKETNLIVVVADSLALPRLSPEIVYLEDSYPFLLQEKYGNTINCASGYSTSNDILSRLSYLQNTVSDATFILNFGIVDCVPRVLTRYESWVLRKLKISLGNFIVKILRKIRTVRKVPPGEFKKNCILIKDRLSSSKYYVLSIVEPCDAFEIEVPKVKESVQLYNQIMREVFPENFLEVKLDLNMDVMSDFYHLKKSGHVKIFNLLSKYL